MQRFLFLILLMLPMTMVQAAFHDPMQPPPYALKKMQQEKAAKNKPLKNQVARVAASNRRSPMVLSSILISAHRKSAIINDRLVKKGDAIDGAKVLRIARNSVRLIRKGKLIILRLDTSATIRMKSATKSHVEKTL